MDGGRSCSWIGLPCVGSRCHQQAGEYSPLLGAYREPVPRALRRDAGGVSCGLPGETVQRDALNVGEEGFMGSTRAARAEEWLWGNSTILAQRGTSAPY